MNWSVMESLAKCSPLNSNVSLFLKLCNYPPAYVVRSTGVSLSVYRGEYPSPRFLPRSLVPGPFWEYLSPRFFLWCHVLSQEGYPRPGRGSIPVLDGGSPGLGGTPGQGYPPGQDSTEVPHPQDREQQRECLLRGGRYTSCGHAGGLPCWNNFEIHFFNLLLFQYGQATAPAYAYNQASTPTFAGFPNQANMRGNNIV